MRQTENTEIKEQLTCNLFCLVALNKKEKPLTKVVRYSSIRPIKIAFAAESL